MGNYGNVSYCFWNGALQLLAKVSRVRVPLSWNQNPKMGSYTMKENFTVQALEIHVLIFQYSASTIYAKYFEIAVSISTIDLK